ncbi:CPBP family intramembrane metalloprotease [Brevibacterium sp. R8603A2]|uniref:CPBP family intramembrane glutamic endopeptidase n=1 Tax=Brevibacterium sp. R8603A2 TaxID=2929779 RepID=UPI001FFA51C6|nr:CPBP family intramembrane glutamic endopeptidase [Brevibacterium sp. R8603A2]MCK1802640.1 CPBP family intramembrane metalloprotease [Brevibacterium sp. R8603A2]
MTDFIPQTISALIQILIFLLIPFIWWLVTARRTEPFFRWLGWKRPRVTHPGRLALVIIGTLVVAGAVGVLFISAAADVSPSPLTGLGFADLGAAIVYAVAQTAFAEESLFRGFLLKRIAARFGFWTGNVVQAVLFGLVHMVPFLLLGMSPLLSLGTGVYSAALGLVMGWINERKAGGSIVPSWILHAVANLISAGVTLFVLG